MKQIFILSFILVSFNSYSQKSIFEIEQPFKVIRSDTFHFKNGDTLFTEIVQVQTKNSYIVQSPKVVLETKPIQAVLKEECVIPNRVEWQLTTSNLTEPLKHRIQFLSVQHNRKLEVPFSYYEETDGCVRRFYYNKEYKNLQEALKDLPEIRKYYPDAFPISYKSKS